MAIGILQPAHGGIDGGLKGLVVLVVQFAAQLEAAHLPDHARYFRVHQRRMQYQEFRDDGYPIGSGTVESAIKQFKARLAGPGMRWSPSGARQMLLLRASVLDSSFDARWDALPLN